MAHPALILINCLKSDLYALKEIKKELPKDYNSWRIDLRLTEIESTLRDFNEKMTYEYLETFNKAN